MRFFQIFIQKWNAVLDQKNLIIFDIKSAISDWLVIYVLIERKNAPILVRRAKKTIPRPFYIQTKYPRTDLVSREFTVRQGCTGVLMKISKKPQNFDQKIKISRILFQTDHQYAEPTAQADPDTFSYTETNGPLDVSRYFIYAGAVIAVTYVNIRFIL